MLAPMNNLFLTYASWLLGWSVFSASGAGLKIQPLLNPRSHILETGSIAAKVAGSTDRAFAAISRAWVAQSVAAASEMSAEELATDSLTKATELKDMSSQATAQANVAGIANEDAINAVRTMESSASETVSQAKEMAVQRVQQLLASKYQELDTWRKDVLKDPYVQASKAVPKAQEPYNRALNSLYDRIQSYQSEIASTARQATQESVDAQTVSDQAEAKMQGGDIIGANQDLQLARSMLTRAGDLAHNAETLQASAAEMNNMVPLYYSAGLAAVASADHEGNPNSMPPFQMDPNIAFGPPPR